MRCLWLVNPAQWQGSKPTCDGVWAEAYDSHPSPSLVSFSSFTSALTENVSGPAVLRAHTSQWPFLRVYHHGCLRISGRDDLTTVSQSAPLSSKSRRRQTELWQSWKEENQMKHLLFPGSHWHSSGPATQSPESSVSKTPSSSFSNLCHGNFQKSRELVFRGPLTQPQLWQLPTSRPSYCIHLHFCYFRENYVMLFHH